MMISQELRQRIETRFEQVKVLAKGREEALFSVLGECNEDELICMKYLYAYMVEQDLANYDGAFFLKFVKQALKMRALVPWKAHLKDDLFLNYVLQFRVNNEHIEFYTEPFFEELFPIIKDMTMHEAVVAINYWSFSKATYQSADMRTSSPFTVLKNAYGRCGEESTFNVSALRSVGIPARQIYAPRWAHCDDNHAWTEAWIDGEWHFLGACEPEPILDTGWYMLPASKGMLIHSRVCSHNVKNEEIVLLTEAQTEINVLSRYADTTPITIQVQDSEGNTLEGVNVRFELVNYSEFYPLTELVTNAKGEVQFLTGYGDLMICAHKDGVHIYGKIDVRKQQSLTLTLPEIWVDEADVQTLALVPSEGKSPEERVLSDEVKALHEKRNTEALHTRKAYEATFYIGEKAVEWAKDFAPYEEQLADAIEKSRGNYEEIQKFVLDEATKDLLEDKVKILGTLRKKDFADTSAETLKAHLLHAKPYQSDYEDKIFVNYVLAPRIFFEMITPYRQGIEQFFTKEQQACFKAQPETILEYIEKHIKTTAESTYSLHFSSPVGLLELGYGSELSQKILFVAICRTFGIPARFGRGHEGVAYYKQGVWVNLLLGKAYVPQTSKLTLKSVEGTEFSYYRNYTIGKLTKGVYETVGFGYGQWENDEVTYTVGAGRYRIVTSNRYADGSLALNLYYITLIDQEAKCVEISLAQMVQECETLVEIPQTSFMNLNQEVCKLQEVIDAQRNIIAYLEVGAEPTEHLFNEILESAEKFNKLNPNVVFVIKEYKDLENATLQKVIKAVPQIKIYVGYEKEALDLIYDGFEIRDKKLPLAYIMNQPMRAQNAWAGYNVGIGEMLLKYLD